MCHTLVVFVTERGRERLNTTNGKIAAQSKQKIADALLFVMERYSFKEITVTQLAQEAGLSRKTFYRLFDDKEAVLSYWFEKLYIECIQRIRTLGIYHYWEVMECYFDFWEERKQMLLLFKRHGLLAALFDGAYKYSFDIFLEIRSREILSEYAVPLPYLLAYSIGGIHSMLIKWAENDMEIPSRELIGKLRSAFASSEV